MTTQSAKRAIAIPLTRVQFLADMIFATSMTIMVLNFDMPGDLEINSQSDLAQFFDRQREALLTYIISFLLVFIYWMKHLEHFSHIKDTSPGHVWLQAGFLMFLMVVPVGNTLYSSWPENQDAATFYCFIVMMVGLFSFLSWRYATKDHRLVDDDMEESLINDLKWETLVEPAAALVAIFAIWFVNPDLVEPIFLLLPILYAVRTKFRSRKAAKETAAGESATGSN